jgi:hypothetical protein
VAVGIDDMKGYDDFDDSDDSDDTDDENGHIKTCLQTVRNYWNNFTSA